MLLSFLSYLEEKQTMIHFQPRTMKNDLFAFDQSKTSLPEISPQWQNFTERHTKIFEIPIDLTEDKRKTTEEKTTTMNNEETIDNQWKSDN